MECIKAKVQQANCQRLDCQKRKFKISHFVKIYFDFAYYTCTCPFRMRRVSEGTKFQCITWKPQQLVCAILHITCVFRLFADVRNSLPPDDDSSKEISQRYGPVQIFETVSKTATLIFKCITIKRFWMNCQDYVNVAIVAEECVPNLAATSFGMGASWIQNEYIIYLIYAIPTFEAVCRFFFLGTPLGMSSDFEWSPFTWLSQFVTYSPQIFGFQLNKYEDANISIRNVTCFDAFMGVLTAFSTLERTILSFYCDLCILANSLTLWIAAKTFSQELFLLSPQQTDAQASTSSPKVYTNASESTTNKNVLTMVINIDQLNKQSSKERRRNANLTWQRIYNGFKTIHRFSGVVNRVIGSQVALFMVEVIMHYSIYLNGWFRSKDFYWRITWTLFYVVTCSVLMISADVCNQMETVKNWLNDGENIKWVPFQQVYLVLQQLADRDISVRGSNIFILTYSLLGTSLGLIITFFIIFLQNNNISSSH